MTARQERAASAPVYVEEEITGRYEGAELEERRARRSDEDRFRRLEAKSDATDGYFISLSREFGEVKGALGILVKAVESQQSAATQRQTVTWTSEVEVDKAEKFDVIAAKKFKRDLIGKTVATVLSGTGAVALVIALISSKC